MKRASGAFLAIVTLIGLVFGGFLLSGPSSVSTSQAVDTTLLYRSFSPISGNPNSAIKIVVFSDYLCPYCKKAHEALDDVISKYSDQVSVYHRNLIIHDTAEIFVKSALAADVQGKFGEFDRVLFERDLEPTEDAMLTIAAELGLDIEKFKNTLHSKEIDNIIAQDQEDALALQVMGTPTLYLNNELLDDFGTLPEQIEALI